MAHGMTQTATEERRDTAPAQPCGLQEYLTPEEAATRLHVSRQTVYEWLKLGRLRGQRAGRAWRINPGDVEALTLSDTAWQERLDRLLTQVRSRIPEGITPEEIEADITAAAEEDRRERCASGR